MIHLAHPLSARKALGAAGSVSDATEPRVRGPVGWIFYWFFFRTDTYYSTRTPTLI